MSDSIPPNVYRTNPADIPASLWAVLDWFIDGVGEPPSVTLVRAAAGCGLLPLSAVGWAMKPRGGALGKPMGRAFITNHGLAALAWREKHHQHSDDEPTEEAPLKERVLAVLTGPQQAIMERLWKGGTASFGALLDTPGCFQPGVTDGAVKAQIRRMNGSLAKGGLPVTLAIAGNRVNLKR